MFEKFFKRKQMKEKQPVVGKQVVLHHDITVYQYGTVFIDGERYCVKTDDNSEHCKGTLVEVLKENPTHLIVKKCNT